MKFNDQKKNFTNILNNQDKIIKIKTPKLKCPFGIEFEYNKYLIKLELTGLKNNNEIIEFNDLIQSYIKEIQEYMKNSNLIYSDFIRYSDKYDPLMKFFLPVRYDKFEVDFYKNGNLTTFKDINKNDYLQLEMELISIWKLKNKYGLNFKIKKIFIS
jgi:hypothetical protein